METNSLIIGIAIGLVVGVVTTYVFFKSYNELTKAVYANRSQLPAQAPLQPQLFEIERDDKGRLKTMLNASIMAK